MSTWTVNSGTALKVPSILTVEDHVIRFISANGNDMTIEDINASENGDFDFKAPNYEGKSLVSGYAMTGTFRYRPGSPLVDDPDDFSATRVGPPVDLSSWQVSSKNSVIVNYSTIEVWPDFVTFVSAVDRKTVLIPGVHAVADRGFTIVPSEGQPYAGRFTLDGQSPVARMMGSISYDGGPAEDIEAIRK